MKITRHILTGQIKPPMLFMASEGGGGGGSAVAEPDEAATDTGNSDVVGFKPAGIDDMDFGNGETKPGEKKAEPESKPDPAKPAVPEKKPDPAPAAKKPDEKQESEPVGAQLREQYAANKKELAEAKAKLEAGDPRIKELEAERDSIKAERESLNKRLADREARDMENDPAVLKPLKEFDAAFEAKADRFYSSMERLSHEDVVKLMPKWFALKKGDDDYSTKRADFDAALNKALGAEEGERHPSYERALDWILQCQGDSKARHALVEDIKKNASTRFQEHAAKTYTEKKSELTKAIEAAKGVPEGLEARIPTHPKVVLSKILGALEPKQVEAIQKGIPEFIERIQLGGLRRPDSAYPGMSPDQIKEARAAEASDYEESMKHLPDVIWNGLVAMRVVGALTRDNAKLRERLGEKRESDPPDPSGDSKQPSNPTDGDPLKGFVAPSTEKYDSY